jgi:hypothetical protein
VATGTGTTTSGTINAGRTFITGVPARSAASATGGDEIVYSCHYRKSSKLFTVIDM